MIRDLLTYLKALGQDWLLWMSGAIGVAAWVTSVVWQSLPTRWIFATAAACSMLIATFRIWRKERQATTAIAEQLAAERAAETERRRDAQAFAPPPPPPTIDDARLRIVLTEVQRLTPHEAGLLREVVIRGLHTQSTWSWPADLKEATLLPQKVPAFYATPPWDQTLKPELLPALQRWAAAQ